MNNHSRDRELIRQVERMIELLETQFPEEEYENGWTEASRGVFGKFFKELRDEINSGRLYSEQELSQMNIARSMDHWGIVEGELLELGARIWLLLRERQSRGLSNNDTMN